MNTATLPKTGAEPILVVESVTREFPGVRALSEVSFDVRRGEIHALVGENGAGKSTLMNILSGVHPAGTYSGRILRNGEVVRFSGTKDAEAAGISIIHQELNLVPELSVAENLFLAREPTRFGLIDWRALYDRSRQALDAIHLDVDPRTKVRLLPVGRQQMVEIAKALLVDADVLLLDEPTSALTETETETLFGILRDLRARGHALVYISHKLDEVFALADRITVFRDGQSVGTRPVGEVTRAEVVSMMVGRDIADMYPKVPSAPGNVVLEVGDYCVENPSMPGEWLVADASFQARAGEVLGFAGLLGSGRTELVMSIFGGWPGRSRGTVRFEGRDVRIRSPRDAIALGIGLVTEDRKEQGLILCRDVRENHSLASLKSLSSFGMIRGRREWEQVRKSIQELRIRTPSGRTLVVNLSGGNQQKVVLGKWLATSPKLLILDEPTRGIDVGAKVEIYRLINELAAAGVAIVLISSELPEVLSMSDRILVMHEGRIQGELSRAEATQEAIMHLATGGR